MSVASVDSKATSTGGRSAATRHIPPILALAVGAPSVASPPGWKWRALSDLARLESGHTPSRRHPEYWGGSIPWVSIRDAKAGHGKTLQTTDEQTNDLGILNSSARVLPAGTVCLSRTASVGYVTVLGQPMATSQDFVSWVCGSALEPDFLKYLLLAEGKDLLRFASGSVHQTIYFPEAKAFHVCVPERSEQQRIVAILDEAFEGIATAKANAEKNLQKSRELFEGYLRKVFAPTGATISLAECASSISDGDHAPPPKSSTGIPFITISNLDKISRCIDLRDTFTVSREYFDSLKSHRKPMRGDVLYTVTGSFGIPVLVNDELDFCFQRHIGLIRPKDDVDSKWLAYALLSPQVRAQAEAGATGTAQRTVSLGVLRRMRVPKIELEEQRAIATKVDAFEMHSRRLGSIAKTKLAVLEELKKSLLHQAFSGQLISSKQTSICQQAAPQTTTPEFTANVISIAHARHERLKREKTFGRVKEQKTLHLIESIAGLDLGRQPMRDAAGPNDFQHMLQAEGWAKAQGFFEMVRTGDGYEFRKLSRFDEQMSRARESLAPYLPQIEPVIDLLVPLDKEEAEVFATVHAAWNNLLIDGKQATDDAIVLAARRDWHPDKLKIQEHKFRTAIEKIRQKNVIPTGSAKYVGGQKTLFDQCDLPVQRR